MLSHDIYCDIAITVHLKTVGNYETGCITRLDIDINFYCIIYFSETNLSTFICPQRDVVPHGVVVVVVGVVVAVGVDA